MAKLFPLIFAFVLYSISQFSLWNVSQYLSHNPLQAYLLFHRLTLGGLFVSTPNTDLGLVTE